MYRERAWVMARAAAQRRSAIRAKRALSALNRKCGRTW